MNRSFALLGMTIAGSAIETIGGISAGASHHPPFGHLLQRRRLEIAQWSVVGARLATESIGEISAIDDRSFDFAQDDG